MILPNLAFRLSVICPRGPRGLANQEGWPGQVAPDAKSDWAGQPKNLRGGSTIGSSGGERGPLPQPYKAAAGFCEISVDPWFCATWMSCFFLLSLVQ
ncbi:hypothetical protein ASPFODRAFT_40263 [Aspergillus luchuensis CBS 106.47]|uniref:Uncharacterized protein n=1 Tax=Aspergillus luchuensis (strain CBS 106.47) TaxID=1137211 RepID=A0A1M3U1H4_ASPLC|nr:hypothetical protein ASPFODRAFT_40263 [Aspergillus luchuensis CBS 106.47]